MSRGFRTRKKKSRREAIQDARTIASQAIAAGQQAWMILVAVLSQQGGSATVTEGTINQVGLRMKDLDYVIEPSSVKGEFIVRVTEVQADGGEGTDAQEPDVNGDHTAGSASRDPAKPTDDNELHLDPATGTPESADQRRSDLVIRRIGDDVVAEGGD